MVEYKTHLPNIAVLHSLCCSCLGLLMDTLNVGMKTMEWLPCVVMYYWQGIELDANYSNYTYAIPLTSVYPRCQTPTNNCPVYGRCVCLVAETHLIPPYHTFPYLAPQNNLKRQNYKIVVMTLTGPLKGPVGRLPGWSCACDAFYASAHEYIQKEMNSMKEIIVKIYYYYKFNWKNRLVWLYVVYQNVLKLYHI